jgi:hypothetical protein
MEDSLYQKALHPSAKTIQIQNTIDERFGIQDSPLVSFDFWLMIAFIGFAAVWFYKSFRKS